MTPSTRLPDLDGTARRDRRLAQVAADTFERSRIGGFLYVIGWVAVAITGRADIARLRMAFRPPVADDLCRDVDAALYAAKAEGRNRVCASPGVPAGD